MTTPEQIYETVKILLTDQANEFLNFAQFLKVKTQRLEQRSEIDTALLEMIAHPDYQADVTTIE
jgi:hypothetical protein